MLLVIDTSGPALTTGLFDGERVLAVETVEIGRGHAERLSAAVRARLAEASARPSDISRVAAVAGPGSFTGLRAGLAFARGLGLGLGVPVVGVNRLRALACSLARPHGPVHVVLDARRGAVFEQPFTPGNEPMGEMALTPVADFATAASALAGSGAALVAARAACARVVSESDAPDAAAIAAVARIDPRPARPVYGRGADARVQASPLL